MAVVAGISTLGAPGPAGSITCRRTESRARPPERSFEEVVDSILGKVEAIERHENKRLLEEEGWSQDEEGRMIPPGWVRKDPPSPG